MKFLKKKIIIISAENRLALKGLKIQLTVTHLSAVTYQTVSDYNKCTKHTEDQRYKKNYNDARIRNILTEEGKSIICIANQLMH